MKTEVYSWRLPADLKTDLEREARRRNTSVSSVLHLAARDFLKKSAAGPEDEEEQLRLRQAALEFVGSLASGDTRRSGNVRKIVRQRLGQRYGR